jgi:hypothetical protein
VSYAEYKEMQKQVSELRAEAAQIPKKGGA